MGAGGEDVEFWWGGGGGGEEGEVEVGVGGVADCCCSGGGLGWGGSEGCHGGLWVWVSMEGWMLEVLISRVDYR